MTFSRPARTLHLIDIENLLSTPRPECGEVSEVRRRYSALASIGEHDHVVIACNHGAAVTVGVHWCDSRLLVASGPSGADIALLDVLVTEHVRDRYDHVVLASGDGIFAGIVAALAAAIPVTVVSRPDRLSRALRLAASAVVDFPDPNLPPPALRARVAA